MGSNDMFSKDIAGLVAGGGNGSGSGIKCSRSGWDDCGLGRGHGHGRTSFKEGCGSGRAAFRQLMSPFSLGPLESRNSEQYRRGRSYCRTRERAPLKDELIPLKTQTRRLFRTGQSAQIPDRGSASSCRILLPHPRGIRYSPPIRSNSEPHGIQGIIAVAHSTSEYVLTSFIVPAIPSANDSDMAVAHSASEYVLTSFICISIL
jgi:hypothetical protein